MKKIVICLTAAVFAAGIAGAQTNLVDTMKKENATTRSANSGFAEEEFRRGVQSYYRGSYNEAIQEFEKALSYLPGESTILDWLGKSYYKAGIEGSALQQWQFAAENGYGGILLQNRMEIVGERRITQPEYDYTQHYTESGSFPNVNGKALIYSQPISSLANRDGTIWVAAYGSNEILHYDVNGVVIKRVRGPLNGFDRPMDIIRLQSGNLLVSEFAGDRLALLDEDGDFIKYYGSKGRGEGQMIGPQYLAEDSYGNIYVTDFGNCRVVVFDPDGNPLLHFGAKTQDFAGFKSPTGIAVVNDRIFVADSVRGAIYEFDRAGNFIGNLVNEKTFARPESMKNWGDFIIVTDKNRIVTVDTETGSTFENGRTPRGTSQITSAVPDKNGNLIVTDFKGSDIFVMSKMTELVGGFFVQIERVISDNFPQVTLEVRVENRRRQPIVGLSEDNFLVTENKIPVADMKISGAANNNDTADITLLIDRSKVMEDYAEQVNTAVREITGAMNGKGRVTVISVGDMPVTEYTGSPENLSTFSTKALKAPYTDNAALDLGVRLAANDLVNAEKKRGVIYITAGTVSQNAFTKYSLSDLSAYLNNNAISFSTVLVRQEGMDQEVDYLTESTTGKSYYVYRAEGLSPVITDLIALPSGLYQIKFTSGQANATEYGKRYLPIEVETYLLNRSGKDESGYFAPLQ
ncbi:MAG TPA: hypothetical protein DCM57_05775 [Treponema sp.]|jgi:DNA-binding beta-propeller fold protein YncE|nr:hypothetical protein [Treponema sp.]